MCFTLVGVIVLQSWGPVVNASTSQPPTRLMKLEGNGVQVKWRAELRERELERMSGLEGEWRRREAARTAEVAKIKAHYAQLDTQTRQVGSTSLQGPGEGGGGQG